MSIAALGGEQDQRLLGCAVEDDRGVVLDGDVGGRLDPDLVHGEAADVHPEDRAGVALGLVAVVGHLDAAGLAAAADQDLRLDDARVADPVRRGDRLLERGGRGARRHRDAVTGEELLALIFEEVHERRRNITALARPPASRVARDVIRGLPQCAVAYGHP
jgi:hypothetical protein